MLSPRADFYFDDVTPRHPGAGYSVNAQLTSGGDGFSRPRRDWSQVRADIKARHTIRVAECAKLWSKFKQGHVHPLLMQEAFNVTDDYAFNKLAKLAPHIFQETMTRSDFTNLTTHVMDRYMLDAFPTVPSSYEQICYINDQIKDFRTVERWVTDNGEGVWNVIQEMERHQETAEDTGKFTYGVKKYAKGGGMSWESVINDDMNQLTDFPQRIATGGKRTIEQFFLRLIAGTAGPNTSFYGTAIALPTGGTIKNVIDLSSYGGTNNPVLNAANLILATGLFLNIATAEGRPMDMGTDVINVLVADGVLYQTLRSIMNAEQLGLTILGGSKASANSVPADLTMLARNWLRGGINPVHAPELRNIMTSNSATSWWLFAKARRSRPAVELGFLRGWREPAMFRKLPNTVRIGGGSADEIGDFDSMSTEIKGVVVVGGTRMDPRMTMASNGTGS